MNNLKFFLKSLFLSEWVRRLIIFFVFAAIFLTIKNKFYANDEFFYVINLNRGVGNFHNYHVLSNPIAHIVWFFTSFFGIKISAFRVMQITSSVFAAIGATALVDLGMFWGLSLFNSFLISSSIIFCNGFIRYGTCAYPELLAIGTGLVSINLLVRLVYYLKTKLVKLYLWLIAGFLLGLASLMHFAFIILVPVLFCGISFMVTRAVKSLSQKIIIPFLIFVGIFLSFGLTYLVFLPLCVNFFPDKTVLCQSANKFGYDMFLTAINKNPGWFLRLSDLVTDFKTHGAIFIPGVHSNNLILDKIFDLPRILIVLLFFWFLLKALRNLSENRELFTWIIIFTTAAIFEFFVLLLTGYAIVRQYALISLSVIGPLFVAIICLAFKDKLKPRIMVIIFLLCILFYSIFGIEGVIEITTYASSPYPRIYNGCDIFRPKYAEPFFSVDKFSPSWGCTWDPAI